MSSDLFYDAMRAEAAYRAAELRKAGRSAWFRRPASRRAGSGAREPRATGRGSAR
ncbi:hypothetical protein OG943_01510 [Amycolatopsis sp. NBC_00345]|uniref:hypothetical protein n=1 Tax=Amycolatopsis sp. NBC_00345 TaxID=2975955 RepID=UPI002E271677